MMSEPSFTALMWCLDPFLHCHCSLQSNRQTRPRMANFSPPEAFDFNRPDRWPDWKQHFSHYRMATKLNAEVGEIQKYPPDMSTHEDSDFSQSQSHDRSQSAFSEGC